MVFEGDGFYNLVHQNLLSQWVNLEYRFTRNRQPPVRQQVVPVYFDPCLYQLHLGGWQITTKNRTILNGDGCLVFSILRVNVRSVMFLVVVEIHQHKNSVEHRNGRHDGLLRFFA